MAHSFPCILCGGPIRRPLFAVGPARFWRCPVCGLVQMNPLPAPGGAPGEDYAGFDLEKYRKFMAEFRIPQYERDLAFLREHAPGRRLLDIGCGMGEFLDVAARGGFRVFGLEPSRTAAEIARRRHPVVRGELGSVEFKAGAFDAATAWSVLEHVPAPADFLRKVRGLLAPGGCLALRVPDVRGLLPALALAAYRLSFKRVDGGRGPGLCPGVHFRRTRPWLQATGEWRAEGSSLDLPLRILYQLDWHYKHLYGFDRRTIARLLADNGFEVAAVRSEPSFDYRSLDLRMDYLPFGGAAKSVAKGAAKWALGLVLLLARLLGRQDELVLVARKKG